MTDIDKFDYPAFKELKAHKYWSDWPVVYLIKWWKELYVWETIAAFKRSKQHLRNPERKKLDTMYLISDQTFNKSSVLDIESRLIQYMVADQKFILQNKNWWLQNHSYYNRELYKSKFEVLWEEMKRIWLANKSLLQLRNSDLFKYSPYKSLSSDQLDVAENITEEINKSVWKTFVVSWKPWTWKTILAIYLVKSLLENEATKHLNIWLVVPMTSLRGTLKKVFKSIKWLKSNMILWPGDVIKNKYDVLFVDEAHRLQRRKAITNYWSFDKTNQKLWLGKDGTHLDRILQSSRYQVFFYDKNQSIRPSDIPTSDWNNLSATKLSLSSQMRVLWWDSYIELINDVFDWDVKENYIINDYDIKLFDRIDDFYYSIQKKNREHWLSRMVAWFAREWVSNKAESGQDYDIEIDWFKLKRNNTTKNRVNSEWAEEEVGCIHTIQWYDLNYVWVIIWDEISYDLDSQSFVINKSNYKDTKGKLWINDDELKQYILNIYKTLLTRWILWTYIFIVDPTLRKLLKDILKINVKID